MRSSVMTLFFTLGLKAHAMKPAPFENVDYVDTETKIRVLSVQITSEPNSSAEKTTVVDTKGKELWTAPIFTGRHLLRISPDGSTLVLFGNYWFQNRVQPRANEIVTKVYDQGALAKEVTLQEILDRDPQLIVAEKKIKPVGGGWVSLSSFLRLKNVDWKNRRIHFELKNGVEKAIAF